MDGIPRVPNRKYFIQTVVAANIEKGTEARSFSSYSLNPSRPNSELSQKVLR